MQLQNILETSYVPVNRSLRDFKLYFFGLAFALGNVILPLLVHSIPNGGIIFLPIFFFTLIAAYSEGLFAGIFVAIASLFLNHAVTGMPVMTMMPTIIFKSILLAFLATGVSNYLKKINFLAIAAIVITMQGLGGLFDFFISSNAQDAFSIVKLGFPGMLIMTIGGYILLRIIVKTNRAA